MQHDETQLRISPEPEISLVVPAFNEEQNLRELVRRLVSVIDDLGGSWEIIFVDDGSKDETWTLIGLLSKQVPRIRGLRLSRNFGHQQALVAGLHCARGKAVISLDADMQHPPSLIPRLISAWKEGYRIVKTRRLDSDDVGPIKKILSKGFYHVFSYMSGVELRHGSADYRLLDRQVVNQILSFKEDGLFLRGIVEWVGYSSTLIEYESENRFAGETKYSLRRMIALAWDGISSFSIVPLRIGVLVGFLASIISLASVLYAIIGELWIGNTVPGWASTLAIVSFLFCILFAIVGVLGEYLGRTLLEVRERPRFIVSEHIGLDSVVDPGTLMPDSTQLAENR